jgi:hypothetical protein
MIISLSLGAQRTLEDLAQDIIYHSDVVANTKLVTTRTKSNGQLVASMNKFLQTEGSYEYNFTEVPWISIKIPSDNVFKLYSWELKGEESAEYFGYIQQPDGSFHILQDQSANLSDIEYMSLDTDTWYGALYYNLIASEDKDGNLYYIAFGINKKEKYSTEKIAEVISFEDGKWVLGKSIFSKENESLERILLSYSSDANVTLNYNESLGLIIFDHLINRMGVQPGQGPTTYPDGSYSGYKYAEGNWIYQDKLYDFISETPPRANPVNKGKMKDLFGRDKKN